MAYHLKQNDPGSVRKNRMSLFFFLIPRIQPVFTALFVHKMDGTGGSELAVKLRIQAPEAVFAQIDSLFHALVACFPVLMV
jgi:hypothetical protein